MGEADFHQFIQLRIHLVIAAENFGRDENLSPVLILTLSKDMDEQLKLAYKLVDVVDRSKRKVCVTVLRYSVDKPENSCAQVRLLGGKREDKKFQQKIYANHKFEFFIYLLDVMISVYLIFNTNQRIGNVV